MFRRILAALSGLASVPPGAVIHRDVSEKPTPEYPEPAFSEAVAAIAAATEAVFREEIAGRPEEHFYAFALTAYDDAEYISAAANTHENLHKVVTGRDSEDSRNYFKWFWGEWLDREFVGPRHGFDNVKSSVQALREAYDIDHPDTAPGDHRFGEYKAAFFDALIGALKTAEIAGAFDAVGERQNFTLFVGIYDSYSHAAVSVQSASTLNPPAVFESWLAEQDY